MKKSFMTRALAMGLSLAMAFSLSAATNVSVASAAATPAMASKQFAVRVGGAAKSYKASAATQKSFKITKATVGNTDKATVKVNSSKKSIKVTPGTVTGSTVVTVTFKNIKTAKSTAKKYRCVVKAAIEDKEPEKPVEEAKATKITEAKAATAKTINVNFDGVVDTSTATAIKVERGTTPITVTAKYADDKKSVVLTSDTSLAAGTYTVTVGTMTSAPFVVAKQTPTTMKITNTTIANSPSARVYFQVLDQYGEVMENYTDKESKLKVEAYNITKGHIIKQGTHTNKEYFLLDCSTEALTPNQYLNAIGDKVSIVAYLTDNAAVSCIAEVEIVRVYTDEFAFGEVKLGNDKRVTVNRTYELEYVAKDNEGKAVTFDEQTAGAGALSAATVAIGNFNFISSNIASVRMDKVFVDSNGHLMFEAENVPGKAIITAINTITGETTSTTITVCNTAKLSSVDIADAAVAVDAADNTKFKAAVTAYDQFGEVIDPKNVKNISFNGVRNATSTNEFTSITVTPANAVQLNKFTSDGKYVEFEVYDTDALVKGQTIRFDFVSKEMGESGYIRSSAMVSVDDEIESSALEIIKAPDATVAEGKNVNIQFAVKDQYQNKIGLTATNAAVIGTVATGAAWMVNTDTYVYVESSNGVISAVTPETTTDTNVYKMTLTARAVDELSEAGVVTLKLREGNKVIASKTFELTVVNSIKSYKLSVDKNKYKAGEKIQVTVDAYSATGSAARFNANYNATVDVFVETSKDQFANIDKKYSKTLKFENGTASFELEAGTAGTNYQIRVTDKNKCADGSLYAQGALVYDDRYEVVGNSAGKLKVNNTAGADLGKLRIYDVKDNPTTAASRTAYAKLKLLDEQLQQDLTWDVDFNLGTLRNDATIPVEIDGNNIVKELNGNKTYSFVTGLSVNNIPNTSLGNNLILSITIDGLTWEKKVNYPTTGSGIITFTDNAAAGTSASETAKATINSAFTAIKNATSSATGSAATVSFAAVLSSYGCDSVVSAPAITGPNCIVSSDAVTVTGVAMTNNGITTTISGSAVNGDKITVIIPVTIKASATVSGVLKQEEIAKDVKVEYNYTTTGGWTATVSLV